MFRYSLYAKKIYANIIQQQTEQFMNKQISARKKNLSQIICYNFKLPPQTIFQDYKCTLKANVTFFGRLYIGKQHLLFISNMFGIIKKCIIDIQKLSKAYSLNQNGTQICLVQKNEYNKQIQFFFTGFKTTNALKLIQALWKRQKISSYILKESQQNEEYNQQMTNLTKQKIPLNSQINAQSEKIEANFFNPQTVQNQKMKVVQVTIPCSVQQFYDYFIDDKATLYPKHKHFQVKKAQKITYTQWKQNKQLNSFIRQFSAIIKVTGVPFKSTAQMNQVWQLKKDENVKEKGFQFKVVTQMADIPYASYFNCQQHIKVIPLGQLRCLMVATVSIVFNKSTYMKGTILKRTFEDIKQDYQLWVKNVSDILIKKKRINERENNAEVKKLKSVNSNDINGEIGDINEKQIEKFNIKQIDKQNMQQNNKNEIKQLSDKFSTKLNYLVFMIGVLILLNFLQMIISFNK